MIVVDANVIFSFCYRSGITPLAEAASLKDKWAAPLIWRSEFRSALIKFIRTGAISLEDANALFKKADGLMFCREHPPRSEKVLEYAAKSKASVYDCEYVVLADDFGTKLVTVDEALITHFPKTAMHLRDYVSVTSSSD